MKLFEENRRGRGWRVIARQDYNPKIIKPGTLCRFAKSKGRWIPKNKDILRELKLIKPVIKRPDYIVKWNHLPREERHTVIKAYLEYRDNEKEK